MSELWTIPKGGFRNHVAPVSDANPLAVYQPDDPSDIRSSPPAAGRTRTYALTIPGIGVSSAYADKDCLGTLMEFPNMLRENKRSGLIHTVTYFDLDDEGLAVDVHFFNRAIASPGNDNAAFAPSDAEALAYIGTASFSAFSDFNTSQVSSGAYYIAVPPQGGTSIFAHAQARGALNIAAGHLPVIRICVLPD